MLLGSCWDVVDGFYAIKAVGSTVWLLGGWYNALSGCYGVARHLLGCSKC